MAYIQYDQLNAWTPTISGSSTAGEGTYTDQKGFWTRIGNMIFFSGDVVWSAHTGTGDMLLTNLPFTVRNATSYDPEILINPEGIVLPASTVGVLGSLNTNETTCVITSIRSDGTNVPISLSSSGTIHFSGNYLT